MALFATAAAHLTKQMPTGYFVVPEDCWMTQYYNPMQECIENFLARNGNSDEAQAIVDAEQKKIELYKRYKYLFSYGVYIAKKLYPKMRTTKLNALSPNAVNASSTVR